MTLTFEFMTRETWRDYVCRVWHTDEIAPWIIKPLAIDAINSAQLDGLKTAATRLIETPGISAVEIIDKDGDGVCVYKDWP